MAIDAKNGRLFAGCSGNKVMAVMDAKHGKLLASVPIAPAEMARRSIRQPVWRLLRMGATAR